MVLRDGAGAELERTEHPYVPLLGKESRDIYPLLAHVDPYGNTIYNRGQMETLLVELRQIRDTCPNLRQDRLAVIDELQRICTEGLKKPHRFLWFIGD